MAPDLALACAVIDALVLTSLAWALWGAVTAVRARAWLAVGLSALCAVGGISASTWVLSRVFSAVAFADPAQKTTLLAAGIADAMGPTTVGWLGAFGVLALGLVGLWRSRTVSASAE